ncbi:MAG TPA: superoxide dismutase [Xanthobacteraceae bacterium]|nr:superoxide dismutase [Xanthobacteraceae bacterium]
MTKITRRVFVAAGAAATLATPSVLRHAQAQAPAPAAPPPGPFKQPPLPFQDAQLAPTIGARTVFVHYNRHGAAYFDNLNALTKDTKYAAMKLEEVIVESSKETDRRIFNNASQAWNHSFYWDTFKPGGAKGPSGRLAQMINESFGSLDAMKTKLQADSVAVFGSGWGWLGQDGNKLVVATTPGGESLLTRNMNALFGIDVWEHAYYLDYENRRGDHLKAVLDNIVNWDVVAGRLKA